MLSGACTESTIFRILRPEPPAGKPWYLDTFVETRGTTRPEDIAPEIWRVLFKAQRAKEIARWKESCDKTGPPQQAHRGRYHVSETEKEEWQQATKYKREAYLLPPAPVMGIWHEDVVIEQAALLYSLVNQVPGKIIVPEDKHKQVLQKHNPHQGSVALAGFVSDEWLALVHTPVKIQDTMRTPAPNAAMDKAWAQLWDKGIWNVNTFREKRRCYPRG